MSKQDNQTTTSRITITIVVLLGLVLAAGFFGLMSGFSGIPSGGNVQVIEIAGQISQYPDNSLFSGPTASSMDIVDQIKKAEADPSVDAVLFEINSPGGAPVASHEITKAIQGMNKTSVALIREVGASGAYWAASAADHVIADELSTTGSVGVFSSYLDFSGLLNDYNVTYERINGGEYKDIGSPFKELTETEKDILQRKITMLHEYFLDDVARNRNLSRQQVAEISTGIFYIGMEAKDIGLVDELGGEDEAVAYLEKTLGKDATLRKTPKKTSFLDALAGMHENYGYALGRGLGFELAQKGTSISLT